MIDDRKLEKSEAGLIARAKNGDRQAFGELVAKYSKAVYYLAYRFVRDHDTADEMTQESFVKAYQAIGTFIEGKSFKSWIFAIAANLSKNYIKRSKRQSSLDDTIPDDVLEDKKVASNPHETVVAKDLGNKISQAVETLPEEYKSVFILRTYEDMSYDEIADTLNIEVGTVMSRLFRARARLKKELKDYLK